MDRKHYMDLYDKHLEFKFRCKWLFLIKNSILYGFLMWGIIILMGIYEKPSFIQVLIYIFAAFLLSILNLQAEKKQYLKRKDKK